MADHNELGKMGEQLARKHLVKKGYDIIECNWNFINDEIDIIAQDKEELVIVEVKTRKENDIETPEEAVTKKKQKFLIRATQNFIEERDIDCETRFDIVAITIHDQGIDLNHIEDAFYPTL